MDLLRNKELNLFHNILYFLNKHAGKRHNSNDEYQTRWGQIAYESAKILGSIFAKEADGFNFVGSTKWQNSGIIKEYFWLQFKRPKHINSPFSISISNVKINGKYHFKVYIEIEDKAYERADNQLELRRMFWRSITDVEQPNCSFYYEGANLSSSYFSKYVYKNLGSKFEDATKNFGKYYKITTNINVIVEDYESDESIIKRLLEAFNLLIPGYDAIFGESQQKECWIIPCDFKQYDIIRAFAKHKELDWHYTVQTKNIKAGDLVYIYVGKPFSRIMYECEVVKTGLSKREIDDSEFFTPVSMETWLNECFRIRSLRKFEGLTLTIDDIHDNGVDGNIQGPRKLPPKTIAYIKNNAISSNGAEEINDEEIKQLRTISELVLEETLEEKDESAGYAYRETIAKVRKINQTIIDNLKKRYKGQCQLCGAMAGYEFGKEIVEAHHIEYFSQTQNNDSSNIIILCPNCHRLIHSCNPVYNKKEICFEFEGGKKMRVINPGHLQIKTKG